MGNHKIDNNGVISILDRMPHVVLNGKKSVHVIPACVLIDVSEEKIKFSDIEMSDDIAEVIMGEWLRDRGMK